MTKKKTYKVPCETLHRVLTVKALTGKQILSLTNKLKKIITDSKAGSPSMIDYIKCLIRETLMEDDKAYLNGLLDTYASVQTPENKILSKNLLVSVYNSVVDIYDTLMIDVVCADINGFITPENMKPMEDLEFAKKLEKETSKKKVAKPSVGINSLTDIRALKEHLNANIVGQEQAVNVICDSLKLKIVGFSKITNLFFIGKTGRGKTELARLLGEIYSENFWIINCGEFQAGHEINKLLGSPPGYIGHSDQSMIKQKSEKGPKWVIVFDEIEKANEKMFNLLLSLMETGTCVDNIGTKIDFSESIFIFTSNCGLRDLKSASTNFHHSHSKGGDKEQILRSLEERFSPEFRNRIDEFVFFNDLTKEDASKIAEIRLRKYPVNVTPELLSFIVSKGYSEEFGAREIDRFIRKSIGLPLADRILDSAVKKSKKYNIVFNGDSLKVE